MIEDEFCRLVEFDIGRLVAFDWNGGTTEFKIKKT